ncbi:uncharacterized protein EV422DRAFT_546211 [Fimicolochytrium jonesii]|uniref:uncharacterized protein n=1 Tax=Fimicolochytrium jonesii TaxID=1396493 RepID=UPI0022FE53D8|nr:uncharacterized protein EV422DRAFT_546211 [Fimicolochytrium jonesii]KAI8816301.1 hypothetical protein EV422DRAFT_546211 [Fimicolochytrium jonesii]
MLESSAARSRDRTNQGTNGRGGANVPDPPPSLAATTELLRKLKRQNHDFVRANARQALRIRDLENDRSAAASAKFELQSEVVQLTAENEMLKAQLKDLKDVRKKEDMEKLQAIRTTVAGLESTAEALCLQVRMAQVEIDLCLTQDHGESAAHGQGRSPGKSPAERHELVPSNPRSPSKSPNTGLNAAATWDSPKRSVKINAKSVPHLRSLGKPNWVPAPHIGSIGEDGEEPENPKPGNEEVKRHDSANDKQNKRDLAQMTTKRKALQAISPNRFYASPATRSTTRAFVSEPKTSGLGLQSPPQESRSPEGRGRRRVQAKSYALPSLRIKMRQGDGVTPIGGAIASATTGPKRAKAKRTPAKKKLPAGVTTVSVPLLFNMETRNRTTSPLPPTPPKDTAL